MAVPPAKLKAFVASLKQQVLDADEAIWKPCFVAFVRLEFTQRGVLVDDIDDDKTQIFLALQSTADWWIKRHTPVTASNSICVFNDELGVMWPKN